MAPKVARMASTDTFLPACRARFSHFSSTALATDVATGGIGGGVSISSRCLTHRISYRRLKPRMPASPTHSRRPSGWRRLARSGLFGSLDFDIRLRGPHELLNVIIVPKGPNPYVHHRQRRQAEVNIARP